jgi:hypothetical protein
MDILNTTHTPPDWVWKTFSGRVEKKLFGPGVILYRFTTPYYQSLTYSSTDRLKGASMKSLEESVRGGQWWFDQATYQKLEHNSRKNGTPINLEARIGMAVAFDWSNMTELIRGRVLRPLFGWEGKTSRQQMNTDKKNASAIFLAGGMKQIYLPNLDGAKIRLGKSDDIFIIDTYECQGLK